MPIQVRELLNWLLHIHILLHCHGAVVKAGEHWVERRRKHVARAADGTARNGECRCLWVAHTIMALEFVRVENDCWPVQLLVHANGGSLRSEHLLGRTGEAGLGLLRHGGRL